MKAELFDRYVHQVGRRLPKKQRDDVQAELHSLLMDALQDRMAERGAEEETATEEDQVAILQEYGPPERVAAQYTPPHRYLIGPRVYDLYLIVVASVFGAITLSHLLLLALTMLGELDPLSALAASFGGVFGSYLGAALSGLGSVTLTFAILERILPDSVLTTHVEVGPVTLPALAIGRGSPEVVSEEKDEPAWDPRTLPEIQDHAQIEVGGLVASVVFTVIGLIVFNVFPEWVGVGFVGTIDGGPVDWHMRPLLASTFFTAYLPLLNVLWMASIGLNVFLLRQGRWQRLTRVVDFVLTVCGAFVLYWMIVGPPILTMGAIRSESLRDLLGSILPTMLKVGLVIGLITTIIEGIQKIYRIFQAGSTSSYRQLDVQGSANQ